MQFATRAQNPLRSGFRLNGGLGYVGDSDSSDLVSGFNDLLKTAGSIFIGSQAVKQGQQYATPYSTAAVAVPAATNKWVVPAVLVAGGLALYLVLKKR